MIDYLKGKTKKPFEIIRRPCKLKIYGENYFVRGNFSTIFLLLILIFYFLIYEG